MPHASAVNWFVTGRKTVTYSNDRFATETTISLDSQNRCNTYTMAVETGPRLLAIAPIDPVRQRRLKAETT